MIVYQTRKTPLSDTIGEREAGEETGKVPETESDKSVCRHLLPHKQWQEFHQGHLHSGARRKAGLRTPQQTRAQISSSPRKVVMTMRTPPYLP